MARAHPAFGLMIVLLCACASRSRGPGTDADAGARADGRTAPSTTCVDMAEALCGHAAECAGDGTAPVQLGEGGAIVYESESFCTGVFTEQCGPDVPAGYNPRVDDPAACLVELGADACNGTALRVGPSCGGSPVR